MSSYPDASPNAGAKKKGKGDGRLPGKHDKLKGAPGKVVVDPNESVKILGKVPGATE